MRMCPHHLYQGDDRLIDVRMTALEILNHIRRDNKTPEEGVEDFELVGEDRENVLNEIYAITTLR